MDPAAVADTFSGDVVRDLYEGLTSETSSGEVAPGVATSWTVDPTGTVYTFTLRADASWSNGDRLRAEQFVIAWRRVVDPRQGSPSADLLRIVVGAKEIIAGKISPGSLGVEAPSDNILVVHLEQPAPFFPGILSNPATFPIYSEEAARTHNPRLWISNGPYVLNKWVPSTSIVLSQNTKYWNKSGVHIRQVEYQVSPDDAAQLRLYQAGQLEMTDSVPANAAPKLRAEHPNELKTAPYLATAYYGLNLAGTKPLASLKLRQALAMSIDRKRVVLALGFGQVAAYGFVPQGTWNYTSQSWPWKDTGDSTRIDTARQLYAEAGYSLSAPLHLRVLYNNSPTIRNTAIIIASMWKETLGVDCEFAEEEYRVFLQSRHDKSRWDVARFSWSADYDDAGNFLDIFRNQSPNNDEGYNNPNFDLLLDQAARTANAQLRRGILESSERIMLSDYPVIPLYFFVSRRMVKPYVRGVFANPLNHVYSKSLSITSP